jgi:peptidoglycan/LPS O-acetylase OafA/YrhL
VTTIAEADTAGEPASRHTTGASILQAGERRSAGIEAVRAFAALAVFASHAYYLSRGGSYSTYGRRLALGGAYGVDLFFVLSGYLLFWPFARAAWGNGRPVSVTRYGINRLWRILPLYYVVLFVLLVLQHDGGTPKQWLLFATFSQNFSHATLGQVDDPMWSLVTEMQFYLALPVVACLLARASGGSRRTAAAILAALGLASFLARQAITWHTPVRPAQLGIHVLDRTVLLLWFFFALGMGLALGRLELEERRPRWLLGPFGRPAMWLLAAVGFWALACYRPSWELAGGLAGVLIVSAAVLPLRRVPAAPWRPLALIGVVSYGIYLWHLPVLFAVSNRSLTSPVAVPGRGLAELVGVGLPVTLLVAALTYWQIERRGLERRRPWS